jgi:hypothetical protein
VQGDWRSGGGRAERRALAVAQRENAKAYELAAATSLARSGAIKASALKPMLLPIYSWFTEGLDTSILQGAKALLDELA